MHMCTCPRSNLEKKGSIAPKNALLRKHTFGKQRYTLKKRRRKNTLNPGRQTTKSEDVLVSKQPRVHECSQPHHESLSNYSHAPSLWHKSALISARCRIREYQLQHLLHLQTQPLKAQQSGSAGINKGRWWRAGGVPEEAQGVEEREYRKELRMRNRRRGLRLYLFSISLCMCQSASQKNIIPAQLSSAEPLGGKWRYMERTKGQQHGS